MPEQLGLDRLANGGPRGARTDQPAGVPDDLQWFAAAAAAEPGPVTGGGQHEVRFQVVPDP